MTILKPFAALTLAVAVAAAAPPAAPFDPVAFFTGPTEGAGRLKKVMAGSHKTRVRSHGSVRADGALVLEQTVEEEGEPDRTRRWVLRRTAPGAFSGTISDAKGPVSVSVAGATMTVRYTMTTGIAVAQTVTVAPGGRTARNLMKFRKFGVTVATLDEVIRKV